MENLFNQPTPIMSNLLPLIFTIVVFLLCFIYAIRANNKLKETRKDKIYYKNVLEQTTKNKDFVTNKLSKHADLFLSIKIIYRQSKIVAFYNGKTYNVFKHSMAQGATVLVQQDKKKTNQKAILGLLYKDHFITIFDLDKQLNEKLLNIDKGTRSDVKQFTGIKDGKPSTFTVS